jgi:hypothetical protein
MKLTPEGEATVVYMCRVEHDYEMGHASDGVRIFPTLESLKEHHQCWAECGIVEVRVSLNRIIVEGNDG